MITKNTFKDCNSYLAQGGISTSLGIFDEENYPVIYGFDSKVPVYIWGGQCEIDFSEVYNYIRFLIES